MAYYDLETEKRICFKFMYIANLLRDICKLKSKVKRLRNHPVNDFWDLLLFQVGSLTMAIGQEKLLAQEVLDVCYDLARTRNQELKALIQHVREMTLEVLDGNYEDNEAYYARQV